MLKNKQSWTFGGALSAFDDLFADFNKKLPNGCPVESAEKSPRFSNYRVITDDNCLTLEIDLPGVNPSDVKLNAVGNKLVIEGPVFVNRYTLSPGYDPKLATATLSLGQLLIKVPGTAAPKPHRINIVLG